MPRRTTPSGQRHPDAAASGTRTSRRGEHHGPQVRDAVATTVAVACGPALYREVLCQTLASHAHIAVAGRSGADDDIGEMVARTNPQVLLFDYEALGPNGEGLIARLRRQSPTTRILVLATRSGPDTVERVLRAGASGLVGKESDLATLMRAIASVVSGEVWANRRVTALALEHFAEASSHGVSSSGSLTIREAEIARWVARGLRNKEIAQRLGINEKTVKTHMNNIFRKLRVDSRIALALMGAPEVQPKT